MTKEQKVALGIDLGTTTTCVGFVKENGEVEIIPTEFGSNTMQSIVFIDTEGKEQMLVGEAALNQASKSPKDTFYEVKRLMGHTFAEVKHLASKLVFEISEGPNGLCYVKATNGKLYSPVEISAGILRKVAQQAESFLGYKADKVVITVPAYFDDKQRRATEEAGKLAGLTVCRIINEPTAAGIAYGLDKQKTGLSAVFDLGGGTFDISIIETMVTRGEGEEKDQIDLRIVGTDGNALVGGSNIDELIMDYIRKEAQNQGLTFDNTPYNFYRLKEAAKSAKQYLSKLNSYDIQIVGFTKDGKTFRHALTRMKLDELAAPIVKQCMDVCERCLKTIKLTTKDIERVILVGGMTRMPLVQAKVAEFFSKKPETAGNPDETVAIGAARSASMFSDYSSTGANVTIIDVTPLTLGIETLGGVFTELISKNTAIPTTKTQVFSTAEDNQSIVSIRVFQGERKMAKDNKMIGSFDLSGISPQQRGIPQIEVTFEVDTNGLLTVSAKDRGSGKEQKISVKDTSKLSRQEIEEMEKRAAQFKEEDEKRVAIIQAKNELSATASTCRSTLDKREKFSAELANQLEEAMRKAQDMVAKEDKDLSIEEIHSLNTEISSLISKASDEISKAEASAK